MQTFFGFTVLDSHCEPGVLDCIRVELFGGQKTPREYSFIPIYGVSRIKRG